MRNDSRRRDIIGGILKSPIANNQLAITQTNELLRLQSYLSQASLSAGAEEEFISPKDQQQMMEYRLTVEKKINH